MEFDGKKFFTTGQAARVLNVSPNTVRWLCDGGELKSWKIPGSKFRRIERQALLDYSAKHNHPLQGIAEAPKPVGFR